MKSRFLKHFGLTALVFVASASPTSISASPLTSVCSTNEETMSSIRADSDPSLWNFIESVCGGSHRFSPNALPPSSIFNFPRQTDTLPKKKIYGLLNCLFQGVEIQHLLAISDPEKEIEVEARLGHQEQAPDRRKRLLIIVDE